MLSCQCRPKSLRNVSSNLVESKTLNKAVLTPTSGPTGYQLGAPNQTNTIEHLSFAQTRSFKYKSVKYKPHSFHGNSASSDREVPTATKAKQPDRNYYRNKTSIFTEATPPI